MVMPKVSSFVLALVKLGWDWQAAKTIAVYVISLSFEQ